MQFGEGTSDAGAGLRTSAVRVALLQEMMGDLLKAVTRHAVAQVLVQSCGPMFGCFANSVTLVNEQQKTFELGAAIGYPPGSLTQWARWPVDLPTPITDAVRSGELVVVPTREERLKRYPNLTLDHLRGTLLDEGCWVAVPLSVRGRVLGAIGMNFSGAPRWEPEELDLLRTFGCMGAGALERARLYEREADLLTQLETANAELEAIFHHAPLALDFFDLDLRYRRVNRVMAEEMNGIPIDQHIGKRVTEVLPGLSRGLESKFRNVIATGETLEEDLTGETPARPGVTRTWRATYFPVRDHAGRTIGLGNAVRDVTLEREAQRERRRQVAREEALARATSLLVWKTDHTGKVDDDSPVWRSFTGAALDAWKTRWGWLEDLHPDDRDRARAAWSAATASKSTYSVEYRVRRHDGEYVWTLARGAPVFDEHGEVVEWVGTNIDITDQVRGRETLEQSVRFAEQLIAMLGHDLRNPLNAIHVTAKLLQHKGGAPELVTRIVSSTQRMSNMVGQLLDLTRARLGGGIPLERRPTNLADVVKGTVDELATIHPSRAIVWNSSEIEGTWDPDRLQQVVSNLVGNALQHGDRTHPVEVRVAASAGEAVLEVQSHGEPIPPDVLPVLFAPYRRRQSGKQSGLGLGLYITQQIVQAHGGRVEVRSTAAEGTTFTVRLPLA